MFTSSVSKQITEQSEKFKSDAKYISFRMQGNFSNLFLEEEEYYISLIPQFINTSLILCLQTTIHYLLFLVMFIFNCIAKVLF